MNSLLEIVINEPFQAELIKHLYADRQDLELAHPKAKHPFCSKQWHDLITKDAENTSLVFKINQTVVGHTAFICNGENLYLCFVIIAREYRKQNLAQNMITQCEEFCRLNYPHEYLWLNVSKQNTNALRLYLSLGYKIDSESGNKTTMKKELRPKPL